MNIGLLIIDPQNDFHDIAPEKAPKGISSALPVTGACEDSKRLADFISRNKHAIDQVYVTLDTHAKYDIGHSEFWLDANGNAPGPFTEITHADIQSHHFTPVDPDMREYTLEYALALEADGQFKIMVWPNHCIKDSWGCQIFEPVKDAMGVWSASSGKDAYVKEKGKNPLTEHYRAFAAEYAIKSDPETMLDVPFLDVLAKHEIVVVSGQALSHCVGESVLQMVMSWPRHLAEKIILLRDTTSPVPGFEDFAEDLVKKLQGYGVIIKTTADFLADSSAPLTSGHQ